MNFTVVVPEGTTNHGNPSLLCTPARWYDYIIFFATNYLAHAFTVIGSPGQSAWESSRVAVLALILPISGVYRALSAIRWHASLERKNPLRRAARAGALCMVAKVSQGAMSQRQSSGTQLHESRAGNGSRQQQSLDPERARAAARRALIAMRWWDPGFDCRSLLPDTAVHGGYRLPPGYQFVPMPRHAPFKDPADRSERDASPSQSFELASSYDAPKLVISLVQAIWATVTLYKSRGDQIDRYGYAAFGLTVTQYAFMSVLNVIGTLVTPSYPAVYMVRTPLMDEAERAGGSFTGEIRTSFEEVDWRHPVVNETEESSIGAGPSTEQGVAMMASLLCGLLPLAIVGGLSGFKARESTPLERGFTMSWLILSIVFGCAVPWMTELAESPKEGIESQEYRLKSWEAKKYKHVRTRLCLSGFYFVELGAAAIGGMVVVGKMISDFGLCTLVS